MADEPGGRTDKLGNRYERNCIIKSILDVADEKISSCMFEGLGEDERATDIIVTNFDGTRKYIQCKHRYGSNDNWTFSGLKSYDLLKRWKFHLDRDKNITVSLESPIPFTRLNDLIAKAKNNNGDVKIFYNEQIKRSNETYNDFKKYCNELELDCSNINDVQKAMNYLRRTEIEDISDNSINKLLFMHIKLLFIGDEEDHYEKILNLVCNGDIMGTEIDIHFLHTFFKSNNMILNNLSNSSHDFENIERLNKNFKDSIKLIKGNFIDRKELKDIIININEEKSIIITGKSGYGKSGIINGVIDYLENDKYQYLALRLDKTTPEHNSLEWSKNLGFNTYLSVVLDKFSTDKKCVLILDQLDALRWTAVHNRNSLDVCNTVIEEIKNINIGRKDKISIIIACRTFDFENDTSIRKIVEEDNSMWERIDIGSLSDDVVENIVGSEYNNYNSKLKQLLKIPSNLFVFMELKKDDNITQIRTTCDLISKWWKQIKKEGERHGITERDLSDLKETIVTKMNELNKISLPTFLLNRYTNSVEFLLSKSFLMQSDSTVAFAHQSLLDYFLVEKMIERYLEGETIETIIGDYDKQLPNKRYQLQMFVERIYEIDDKKFLECVDSIINSEKIRVYMKYVAFEILGTLTNLSDITKQYIITNYNKKDFFDIYVNTVFMNHQEMIDLLITNNVFEKWINNPLTKKHVINLLKSINYYINEIECNFIKKHIIINEQLDKELYSVFPIDMTYDTNELFELRLEIYNKFNEMLIDTYLNLDELLKYNEPRAIKYIEYLGKHLNTNKKHNIKYRNNYIINYDDKNKIIENEMIIDKLLPLIPKDLGRYELYDWEDDGNIEMNMPRIIITLIKKATQNMVKQNPSKLWIIYKDYTNKGYNIPNELILYGILCLPKEEANKVFEYLFDDINKNCFEYTSNNDQSISMLKKITEKFIENADQETVNFIIKNIINYKPRDIIEKCKQCIEAKKQDFSSANYMSFWGDFQYEMLNVIPDKYLNKENMQLKMILDRKFSIRKYSIYDMGRLKMRDIISPIANNKISLKNWLDILTNKTITNKHSTKYDENKKAFVDSSLYEFQSSLSLYIEKEPEAFIDLFVNNSSCIRSEYVYTLYNSLSYSNVENKVSIDKFELLFQTFKYKNNYEYASLICEIISRKNETGWHDKTIKMLLEIYEDIKNGKIKNNYIVDDSKKDSNKIDDFEFKAINSPIFKLSMAISNILRNSFDHAEEFIKIAKDMITTDNEIIKYSSLNILNCLLNYDFEWSSNIIINLLSDDYMYKYNSIRDIINYIYTKDNNHKEQILKIISHGITINNDKIKKTFSYLMVDFYLFYDKFKDNLLDKNNNKIVKNSIMNMLLEYMKEDIYKEKVKGIMLKLASYKDVKINPYKLFDETDMMLLQDRDFIKKIFHLSNSQEMIEPFIRTLKKRENDILKFDDLLFEIINAAIKQYDENNLTHYFAYSDLNYIVIMLFDYAYEHKKETTIIKCLDVWDQMFSKQIGLMRKLSKDLSEI